MMDHLVPLFLVLIFFVFFIYFINAINRKTKELNQASYLQNAILDSANQSIIVTNKKGVITSFNKGAESMLGYKAEEVINKMPITSLYDRKMIERQVQAKKNDLSDFDVLITFAHQSTSQLTEWVLRRKDGSLLSCLQSITELKDSENVLRGFLFIGTDMTERKIWEQELIASREALTKANKSKSQFFANTSHDLRTPLNSIIGFTNVLLKNKWGNLNEQQLSYLQKVTDNGNFLLNLINEILSLNKIENSILQPNLTYTNLEMLIKRILNRFDEKISNGQVQLIADVPAYLKPLLTDSEKLERIIINLVSNAIKFTKMGQVMISVKMDPHTQEAYQIDVSDTGIGIEDGQINKLFKPFYQIPNEQSADLGGSGLGLSIVWSLCEIMGYQIKVFSQPGKGSVFSVILDSKKSD